MKILIVNKSASGGGAAVAAVRLFNALKLSGADVKMLVQDGNNGNDKIESVSKDKVSKSMALSRFILERLYFLPNEKNKSVRFQFSPAVAGADISNHPWVVEADIIHLHWVNHGFLSVKSLGKLFKYKKPIVWTLHDMWTFTGGCHYSGDCSEFIERCGSCPFLKYSHSSDLSHKILERKKKIWKSANMEAVSCSNWLGSLAKESVLLRNKKITSIPNPIDTSQFKPIQKSDARNNLGLPKDKKLLLFGAANVNDPRKGIKYLMQALEILDIKHEGLSQQLELVVFGKSNKELFNKIPFKIHEMNFISDVSNLIYLYNAADVFVLPSLQDNLPNTVMESLACGTPVVAFKIGGVPEMIMHEKTGYLANAKNSDHLAKGIYEIMFNFNSESLKTAAVNFVQSNYSNLTVAERYMNVYKSLLS